ncbi:LacI family DNA-binding transcriptional regulator [Lactobacillus sp. YT155]|uniref:LacI family DNA-binding transcriptional regulator n=1 Tax=Lactobacillus sp. YT155 TaxID=3060955 RepID=UPI00265E8785|nr:LacI family DNA-binding transcriptional regulator [Lactobacillus sp. YT155]MDO1604497.1 LacI family DNA-binding transcriptional regulator [Lactobacillus sp. YT155]
MTTIRDIAEKSGYSITTVSRVLNNRHYVSVKAKQDIEKTMKDLDYVPNAIARDLSRGENRNIGVVLPHVKTPYFTQIINGILTEAFESGYQVVLLPSEYDQEMEMSYLEKLRSKTFSSLIFTTRKIDINELIKYSKYGRIVCFEDPGENDLSAVYCNRMPSFIEAFKSIKKTGAKNIAVTLSRDFTVSVTGSEILCSYQHVFEKDPDKDLTVFDVITYEDGYEAAKKVGTKADCFFATSDDVAAGIRQYYLDNDLKVPILYGQENELSSQLINIPTINHHYFEMGQTAFKMAKSKQKQRKSFGAEFIERK